jgi:hypothetical protein
VERNIHKFSSCPIYRPTLCPVKVDFDASPPLAAPLQRIQAALNLRAGLMEEAYFERGSTEVRMRTAFKCEPKRREDSKTFAARVREAHSVCKEYEDMATAGLIEAWIDSLFSASSFDLESEKSRGSLFLSEVNS